MEYIKQRQNINLKLIPSITSLIAFERTAFHLSFAKAAADIGRTPSAVSHAIRDLEVRLNCELFNRNRSKISLTKIGYYYLTEVRKALEILEASGKLVADKTKLSTVRMRIAPMFASMILIPNLAEFCNTYPDILLEIDTTPLNADWAREELDLEVRMCGNMDQELHVHQLGSLRSVPLCSPDLIKSQRKLKDVEEISQFTFLHMSTKQNIWPHWLGRAGLENLPMKKNLSFNSSTSVHDAVMNGLGIGLGIYEFVTRLPDYGKSFIMPFDDIGVDYSLSYNIVSRKRSSRPKEISAIIDWLTYAFEQEARPVNTNRDKFN
ncbi:MAG: LysR substrate-binding domain-containing protein [Methyloligellaceae bacterium]